MGEEATCSKQWHSTTEFRGTPVPHLGAAKAEAPPPPEEEAECRDQMCSGGAREEEKVVSLKIQRESGWWWCWVSWGLVGGG